MSSWPMKVRLAMLEPTDDNPITDDDRRFAELLDLDPKTLWLARQPLPPLAAVIEVLEHEAVIEALEHVQAEIEQVKE